MIQKPVIYTYHEIIPTWNVHRQIAAWKTSWNAAGFSAIVLNRTIASRHPQFGRLVQLTRTFHTLNDRRYEEACWVRWLAFDFMVGITAEPSLMSDYDVLARGFAPHHLGARGPSPEPILCHESTRVPCLVQADRKGTAAIVDFLLDRKPDLSAHYSDMIAFKESDWPITGFCREYGDPDWRCAPAVHVASGAVVREHGPGADKTAILESLLA